MLDLRVLLLLFFMMCAKYRRDCLRIRRGNNTPTTDVLVSEPAPAWFGEGWTCMNRTARTNGACGV